MRSETTASDALPGDGLIRVGAILFIVGAVATLVTVAPLFLGTEPFPTAAYLVSMLMGVGFLVAAAGVLRTIAAQRRQARAATRSA
ncbi:MULTISPECIES: hypothetical protein [Streptomyces]|uniref:Integral membrane protein n=2 Tax=Streptomyces TaxID=1883 RepID=A0A100Y4I1_9ACTN|nr:MULTISPECIES: hypothetical protein [Streptomyces]KUH37483.1 hypothetical protein ATE80_17915 [Streptomyces kanasensis]UUS31708.1 hypothetical protein NRO40_13270 [Streptomyces changanensis]